jgi:hypothetical protein
MDERDEIDFIDETDQIDEIDDIGEFPHSPRNLTFQLEECKLRFDRGISCGNQC